MDAPPFAPVGLRKFLLIASLVAIFAAGVALRFVNLDNVSRRSPDENVYTLQAKAIATNGIQGMRSLIAEHGTNSALWVFPPPTRVGYTGMLAVVMRATGRMDVKTVSRVSLVFSVISLLVLIALGLRFFGPVPTIYALLFLAVSPLDIAIARRAWQDSVIGCLGLVVVYLSCEIISDPSRRLRHVLFAIASCCCLLVKESGMLIVSLCMAWILWILLLQKRDYRSGLILVMLSLIGAATSASIVAYAAGGIRPAIDVIRHWQSAVPTNRYAIDYQTGPWWHLFHGFWIASPMSFLLCMAGAGCVALSGITDRRVSAGVVFFTAMLLTSAVVIPYFQNLRYVSAAFAPFYLIAGLGLWQLLSLAALALSRPVFTTLAILVAALCIVFAATDYQNFRNIFVRTGIIDTSIRLVREASL